jgi:septal ring factor EnvC (AmiA/AmiB activator)
MADDPRKMIRRLTEAVQQQSKENAALLQKIARQKQRIANRDSTISRLKAEQKASAKQIRAAFATATAYVEAELPKQLEPVLAELRRLQDEEWLREIGEVDPKDAN